MISISKLPPEIITIIFSHLNADDITMCSMVCRKWWEISQFFKRDNFLKILRKAVSHENIKIIKFILSMELDKFYSDYYYYTVSIILGEEGSINILKYFKNRGYSLREAYQKCIEDDRLEEFKWIYSKNCVDISLINTFRYASTKQCPKIIEYLYNEIILYNSFPEQYMYSSIMVRNG